MTPVSTTQAMQLYQVLRIGAVIGTSILLAKSGLSTGDIGLYETLLYLGTTLTFFWVNGLLQGMPPVFGRLKAEEKSVFFFNTFLIFTALSLALFSVLFFGASWVTPALTGLTRVPHYGLFCVYLLLNLPAYPVEYLYLLLDKPRQLIVWGVFSFGMQVIAFFAPLWWGYGLDGGFWGLIGFGALRLAWTLFLLRRHGRFLIRPGLMRRYLGFSYPLIVNILIGNLILWFDNWLVGWYYRDEAVFAIFRYGSREFPLATALATALGAAMTARLTEAPEPGFRELKAKTTRLMHWVFPPTVALLFLSGYLFPRIFNPDFAASAPLFNIYLLMTASRVLLPNAVVLSIGKPRIIFMAGVLELSVKVALGFIFIQNWGLAGVAWSAVAAFWVEKLALVGYLETRQNIRTNRWLDLKWYFLYTCALFLNYLVMTND